MWKSYRIFKKNKKIYKKTNFNWGIKKIKFQKSNSININILHSSTQRSIPNQRSINFKHLNKLSPRTKLQRLSFWCKKYLLINIKRIKMSSYINHQNCVKFWISFSNQDFKSRKFSFSLQKHFFLLYKKYPIYYARHTNSAVLKTINVL